MLRFGRFWLALILTAVFGCGDATVVDYTSGGSDQGKGGKADSSIDAIIVDFEFDGELVVGSAWNPEKQVESQLLFTIGQERTNPLRIWQEKRQQFLRILFLTISQWY